MVLTSAKGSVRPRRITRFTGKDWVTGMSCSHWDMVGELEGLTPNTNNLLGYLTTSSILMLERVT